MGGSTAMLVLFCVVPLLASLILGHRALNKIKREAFLSGKGIAVLSLGMAYVHLAIDGPLIVVAVIYT